MLDRRASAELANVVRSLASAAKAIRLYPASSPIPRQNVAAASEMLRAWFDTGAPVAAFAVSRDGLVPRGVPGASALTGSLELAEALRDHGVAELTLLPGCTEDDLVIALTLIVSASDALREKGGLAVALASAGVETVRVAEVQLTVVEQRCRDHHEDAEVFIRGLVNDVGRLSSWLAAACGTDPAALEEGLSELERVAGSMGRDTLARSLAAAFARQSQPAKDAVLALGMESGPARGLIGEMLGSLSANEIAGAILGGALGKNMLSLSAALTRLPLERVSAEVRKEVRQLLPTAGHTAKEAEFLEHMLEVRSRTRPESALVDRAPEYRAIAEAARLDDRTLDSARAAAREGSSSVRASSVRAMLLILDQQQDFDLYRSSVQTLSSLVPRLIEQGDLALALRVVEAFADHEAAASRPWPLLSSVLEEARRAAAGPDAMRPLLRMAFEDAETIALAREFIRVAGEQAVLALTTEAIALKQQGLKVAELLLGRRIVDALHDLAPRAHWYQLAPIAARLAHESDSRSVATLEALMARQDPQSRRETATGLAIGGGPVAVKLLARALRDPSPEVAVVAVRALVRHRVAGAGAILATRLNELDVDDGDFAVGREIIIALSKVPGTETAEALKRLASRRALIKRGRFAEVQELARQALAAHQGGAGR